MDSNPWLTYPDNHMLVLPGHTDLLLVYIAVKIAINTYSANTPASWETRRLCLSRNCIDSPPWSHLPWIQKFSQPYYVVIKPIFPVWLASWTTANETTRSSKRRQRTYSQQSGWQNCSAQKHADSGIIWDSVFKQPSLPGSSRQNRELETVQDFWVTLIRLQLLLRAGESIPKWIDWTKVRRRNKLLSLQAPVLLDVPYHAGSKDWENISGQYVISTNVLNFTSRQRWNYSLKGLHSDAPPYYSK